MAFLTIGGAAIPCALGAPEQDSPEPVGDEARTLSGRTRRVIRGWVRSWTVTTTPMPLADAQALALVLQSPEPLRCGGDLIGGTVDCYGSLTALRHQKTADGERAVVEFRLVEAAPSSPVGVLFSARRGLPAGAAFSRGSTAWTLLPNGTLAEVAANVPRIAWLDLDGDGVHESPALRLEPSRTNALSWSEDFTQSVWGKWQSSVVAGATTAPDGTMSGTLLIANSVQDSHQVQRSFTTFPDDTDYVVSIFAKARDYTWCCVSIRSKDNVTQRAFFDLVNGTIGVVQNASAAWIEPYPNGWYRVSVRGNTRSGPNPVFVFYHVATVNGTVSFTGDDASGIYIWGAQLEAGPAATSYIRTEGSTVTRAADVLSFPLPASLARPVPLTIYLRFVERGAAFAQAFLSDIVEIGSLARPLLQVENANNTGTYRVLYRTVAGVESISVAPVAVAIGDVVEIAAVLTAAGASRIRIAKNGGAEQVGPLGIARGLDATPWPMQTLRLAVRNQSPLDVLDCALVLGEWTIPQLRAFAT